MSASLLADPTAPDRSRGIWSYVSASRLNLWLRCPLAFRLRYVDGVITPTVPAAFVGKMVHSSLERFYRHRQLGVSLAADDLAAALKANWDRAADEEQVAFETSAEAEASQKQAVDLVAAYLAQVPDAEPRPLAVEVSAEAPLIDPATGEDLGIPLVGIIDLLLPEPDGPVVVDFKTTARGGKPLEVMHEVQLSSYAYLLRATCGQEEAALEIRNLVKTKTPKIETHRYGPRGDAHFKRLFAVIRAYLDDLDAGRFVFRPGLACSSCEFRQSHCRHWQG